MALEFTDSNVKEYILSGKPVMVDFWATWCGPCKALAPLIDQLAQEYDGRVLIGKYNADEENDFAADNRVMGLPTLLFFKDGSLTPVARLTGSQTRARIVENLDKII